MIKFELKILKTFFVYILLLVFAQFSIFRYIENWFDKAFTIVFCYQVLHWPLDSGFFAGIKFEFFWIERTINLRLEKDRRPPALKTLQTIPFLSPARLQIKQKYELLNRILVRLNCLVYIKTAGYESMSIQKFSQNIYLIYMDFT